MSTSGGTRTHTVLTLNQVPPANWATDAYITSHTLESNQEPRGLESRRSAYWRSVGWWVMMDLNHRRALTRQVYSLLQLSSLAITLGVPTWNRTTDTGYFTAVLYLLSYGHLIVND